ncbi:MAG: hypothetical protein AB2L09_08985 [Coriobacteriia bacterium]
MAGQINRGWPMGDLLYELASTPEVQKVLEIGTWRGDGSTLVLAEALGRTGGRLWTMELKEENYRAACEFYADKGLPVELLHGLSVDPTWYPPFEHYWPRIERSWQEIAEPGTYREWYDDEIEHAWKAPRTSLVEQLIAEVGEFDLVLLDGGDFASTREFELLEPHITCYVFMDDTNAARCIKNAQNREHILASPDWEVLVDALDQRYGWMAAKRVR